MKMVIAGIGLVLLGGIAGVQRTPGTPEPATTPDQLQAAIEALRPRRLAWREIAWRSCLLEGLKESREKNKPVLLWVFIDRPVDDARC
jgi:hypothetical protein